MITRVFFLSLVLSIILDYRFVEGKYYMIGQTISQCTTTTNLHDWTSGNPIYSDVPKHN